MVRTHRYPSDLTDAEWALVEAVLPPVSKDGRPGAHSRRDIVDAILYVTHNGIVWRALPAGFPPWQTVYGFFDRWKKKGVTAGTHDALQGSGKFAIWMVMVVLPGVMVAVYGWDGSGWVVSRCGSRDLMGAGHAGDTCR
ncbi:transposase [Frankia sp. B2]|nr:transposase [Frankia sp. B2]